MHLTVYIVVILDLVQLADAHNMAMQVKRKIMTLNISSQLATVLGGQVRMSS